MLKTLLKLSLLFRRCRKSELKVDKNLLNQNVNSIENSVGRAIKQYENHPSIKGIERNVESRIFFFLFWTFFLYWTKIEKNESQEGFSGHGYSNKNPERKLRLFCSIYFEKLMSIKRALETNHITVNLWLF